MRPIPAALTVLATFTLGLAAGGRIPEAAAATIAAIHWMNDGKTLTLANQEDGAGYVVLGVLQDGAQAPPLPPPTSTSVSLPLAAFKNVTVYRIEAALSCDSRECRKCQPGVVGCPAPPPIPIAVNQHQVNLAPKGLPAFKH